MYLAKRERARLKLEGNIAKYHQKRTYIFKEIVQTEENFVTDLQTTLSVCFLPFLAFKSLTVPPSIDLPQSTASSVPW